jgi:5-methylcytosine-specific restriction endonuclease McrA
MDTREVVALDTVPLERLEAEITQLAGELAAAECRWLQLIAEYDRREGWAQWGCHSAVQWLGWHCGLSGRAARDRLRVAHALWELPELTEEFAAGRLSYSKVRALTRVATPMNEGDLVMLARHATASQVDRIVSAYRGVLAAEEEVEAANRQVVEQYLRIDEEDDGSMVIHARMPAEIGAQVVKALAAARQQLCADARGEGGPAGLVQRLVSATNVDAFHLMVESFMANNPACRSGADRNQLIVNVDDDVLIDDSPDGICELDGGPRLAPETARRLGCDASTVVMIRRKDGTLLTATNKTQAIPPRVRRMLHARDQGCRFPGCDQRTFVDAHHIHHRAHGGSNELENLVELCWFHHRLVHEGGWALRLDDSGKVVVTNPAGNVIPSLVSLRGFVGDIERRNRAAGTTIDATTITPRWYGDPLDLGHITTALWCADQRRSDCN